MVIRKGPLEIAIIKTKSRGSDVSMAGFYYIFDNGKVEKLRDIPDYKESFIEWKLECTEAIHKIRVQTMNESDKYKFIPLLLSDEEYNKIWKEMKELN